jgi:hypothetical protein
VLPPNRWETSGFLRRKWLAWLIKGVCKKQTGEVGIRHGLDNGCREVKLLDSLCVVVSGQGPGAPDFATRSEAKSRLAGFVPLAQTEFFDKWISGNRTNLVRNRVKRALEELVCDLTSGLMQARSAVTES